MTEALTTILEKGVTDLALALPAATARVFLGHREDPRLRLTVAVALTDLATYASGSYVYAANGSPELTNPGTTIEITGGTGWTPGTYTVVTTYPVIDVGGGTNRVVYQLSSPVGTHPLTAGEYTPT